MFQSIHLFTAWVVLYLNHTYVWEITSFAICAGDVRICLNAILFLVIQMNHNKPYITVLNLSFLRGQLPQFDAKFSNFAMLLKNIVGMQHHFNIQSVVSFAILHFINKWSLVSFSSLQKGHIDDCKMTPLASRFTQLGFCQGLPSI